MTISIDLQQKAVAMRMAGYSLSSIAANTGISIRALKNIFTRHAAEKGTVTKELLQQTKAALLDDARFKSQVKTHIAALIHSEISISNDLIDSIGVTLAELESTPAPTRAKSLASLSAALKNSLDIQRRALNMNAMQIDSTEIPLIVIKQMSDGDVEAVRKKANLSDLELGNGDDDNGVVCE